ncbi:MAG: hypothetical protein RIQ53_2358 [Pseudomonadota bacterium]|jgi:hypothetical protein
MSPLDTAPVPVPARQGPDVDLIDPHAAGRSIDEGTAP